MKIVSIEFSQVAQLATFVSSAGSLYLPDVVSGLRKRYEFVKFPTTFEELNAAQGIAFEHGKFKGKVIDSLKIFNNGFIVQTKSRVETAESFIEDILAWAQEKFEAKLMEADSVHRTFDSRLIVNLDISLPGALEVASDICTNINKFLSSYGINVPAYVPAGITFHSDSSDVARMRPSGFSIERRVTAPFSSNLYFSIAPLRTADHIALLEQLEELI